MPKHFLYSAKARTISLMQIFSMTDEEVQTTFQKFRWPETEGNPICPHCGSKRKFYWVKSKKAWKCADCTKRFSVTSGTIFAHHKLSLRIYLAAIVLFSNSVKGISAPQVARDLDVSHQTAFVLCHKFREALMNHRDLETKMTGEVEIDGAYCCYYVRPKNNKKFRKDRRLAKNKNPNTRCVMAFRQRGDPGTGAQRTITFMVKDENDKEIHRAVDALIDKSAIIHTDEHKGYEALYGKYQVLMVAHTEEYKNYITEACINQAESLFGRLRRSQRGQYHRMSVIYLPYYANEIAYRDDMRRVSNGEITFDILGKALKSPPSPELCGYWQGNHRKKELIGLKSLLDTCSN